MVKNIKELLCNNNMNTINVELKYHSIKYSYNNKINIITYNSILIISDYKCNIIHSIPNIFKNINIIKNILYYTNNNYYILIIRNDFSNKNFIYSDNILDIYKNINYKAKSEIILYKKINKKYNILSHLYGNNDLFLNYKISPLLTKDMNVLCILDEFSYNCYKYECNLSSINFNNWQTQLHTIKPNFIFVESVWNAVDSEFSFSNIEKVKILKNIIYNCRILNIPTIFWNKEDDINYDIFIKHALLFDIIFTTDERCIPLYKKEKLYKNQIVECLEFACQPMIHNPLNQTRKNDVFFAGRWYKDYPERNNQIESLINIPSYRNKYKIDIYDRAFIKKTSFPEKYNKFIRKKLSYMEVNTISKDYKIMLNVNTITQSNTMFSRRVYEGLASGCCIISTPSIGINNKFKDIVYISDNIETTCNTLDKILFNSNIQELSFNSYKRVIKTDNYKVRIEHILDTAIIDYTKEYDSIVAVISYFKGDINKLTYFIEMIHKQSYKNIIITIFVSTENELNYLNKIFNKMDNIVKFELKNNELNIMKLMRYMYIAKLNINNTYDIDYIYDSILPFLYIDKSIKYIGGVNRNSYNFISSPNKDSIFYRINTNFS